MDGPQTPPRSNETKQYAVHGDGYVPKRVMRFAAGVTRLAPFTERFVFFTIAPAYIWGHFTDIVLWDFLNLRGVPVDFFHMKFDRPLFGGLGLPNGNQDWNHALWALEKEHWEAFTQHVCATVLQDSQAHSVFRFALQELSLVDPIYADRDVLGQAVSPRMPVYAFAVRSNRGCIVFDHGSNYLLPSARYQPADEQCCTYAKVLFREEDPQAAFQASEPSEVDPWKSVTT